MFILPFLRLVKNSSGLEQIWLFLERNGTHLIEIQNADEEGAISYAKEFAELNELVMKNEPFCVKDVVYCEIVADSKELAGFYTWKETPAGTTPPREVWRPFLWMENSDPWGVNRLMESLPLSEASHSVYSVLEEITKDRP